MYIYMYKYINIHMCICMCLKINIYVYIYTYIYNGIRPKFTHYDLLFDVCSIHVSSAKNKQHVSFDWNRYICIALLSAGSRMFGDVHHQHVRMAMGKILSNFITRNTFNYVLFGSDNLIVGNCRKKKKIYIYIYICTYIYCRIRSGN